MIILLLTPELLSVGGIQRHNRILIAAIDELMTCKNGSLRVLSLNDQRPASFGPELAALKATSITCFGGNRPAYVREFIAERRKADLTIYGLLGFTLMSFAEMILRPSGRSLLMLHGIEAWYYRSFWHAAAVRRMHGYVSVSQYTMDRLRSVYSIPSGKLEFILPNVVSPYLLKDDSMRTASQDGDPELLTVSRMDEHDRYKGIDTVLRSLPDLLIQFPRLRYTIIGDGSDRERLTKLAHELDIKSHVNFLGRVSDDALHECYRRCTVFVLPSSKEGFGFVYVESMAYGKPIVAAKAGATPEVVVDGEQGILVDYDNVQQLTAALSTLLCDPDLRQRMGRAGLEAVRRRYSFNALQAKLQNIITVCAQYDT